MLLAHSGSTGGIHFELLSISVAVLVLAVVLLFNKNFKTSGSVVMGLIAVAMGVGAFSSVGGADVSGVRMSIVSPADGANVDADELVDVDVSLRGATVDSSSPAAGDVVGHLHVFVDDQLVQMPTDASTDLTLKPGDHTVAVEFVGDDHRSFEPKVLERIEVTAR